MGKGCRTRTEDGGSSEKRPWFSHLRHAARRAKYVITRYIRQALQIGNQHSEPEIVTHVIDSPFYTYS